MQPRLLVIRPKHAGRTVLEILRSQFRLGPGEVRRLLKVRGIHLGGAVCDDLLWRVRAGQKLRIDEPGPEFRRTRETPAGRGDRLRAPRIEKKVLEGNIRIVHADDQVIVVDKPAGLTTVRHASERAEMGERAQKFLPVTLVDKLSKLLPSGKKSPRIRAVHRIDKETSGLVVLARGEEAERDLGLQFRSHAVGRTYLALVRGRARSETITSQLVRDRGDGRRGSGDGDKGQRAVTHVKVVEEFPGFTLVECRLETGRTHQVRIHLGERGTPLCGERIYDRLVKGQPVADASGATRPMLHAATLSFDHPISKKRLNFSSPLPEDIETLLKRLRKVE